MPKTNFRKIKKKLIYEMLHTWSITDKIRNTRKSSVHIKKCLETLSESIKDLKASLNDRFSSTMHCL